MTQTLTAHDVRRISVEAKVDPRTVERYLAGQTMKSTTTARIVEALKVLKIKGQPHGR